MSLVAPKPLVFLAQIDLWTFKFVQTLIFAGENQLFGVSNCSKPLYLLVQMSLIGGPKRTPWLDWVATDVRRSLWEPLSTRIWAEPFFHCWRLAGLVCSWKRARWVPNHWFAYADELLGLRVAQNHYICLCKWDRWSPNHCIRLSKCSQFFWISLKLL